MEKVYTPTASQLVIINGIMAEQNILAQRESDIMQMIFGFMDIDPGKVESARFSNGTVVITVKD